MMTDRDPVDPALEALLREHSSESPSPALDAAILAAAHRAVGREPTAAASRTRRLRLWMPLAAAAAVAAVVVGVVPLAPTAEHDTAPAVSDTPGRDAAADAPSGAASSAPGAPDVEAAIAPHPNAMTVQRKAAAPAANALAPPRPSNEPARNAQSAAAPLAAPVPPPLLQTPAPKRERDDTKAADVPLRDEPREAAPARTDRAATSGALSVAPPASTPPDAQPRQRSPSSAPAPAAARGDNFVSHPHTADEWVARIEWLRAQGDRPAALAALAAFRAAHADADARLPKSLRDWANAPR